MKTLTNVVTQTLTNTITQTLTNTISKTLTNEIIDFRTNTITRFVTNVQVVQSTITNQNITTVIQGNGAQGPYFNEDDSAALRDEIRVFFRNRDSNNKAGLRRNVENFRKLQSGTRNRDVALQSTLFLGQAYFHLDEYSNAFREFVKLRESMPDESRGWINRCVERMR